MKGKYSAINVSEARRTWRHPIPREALQTSEARAPVMVGAGIAAQWVM